MEIAAGHPMAIDVVKGFINLGDRAIMGKDCILICRDSPLLKLVIGHLFLLSHKPRHIREAVPAGFAEVMPADSQQRLIRTDEMVILFIKKCTPQGIYLRNIRTGINQPPAG